jgi:hypothetical protein
MKLFYTVFVSMMLSSSLFAQNIHIEGTISHRVPMYSMQAVGAATANDNRSSKSRVFKLLKVTLSHNAQQILAKNLTRALANQKTPTKMLANNTKLPRKIELGMDNVPVFDQGNHGSCVAFAVTAAIDAAIYHDDYISQLCQLQVGNYLQANSYSYSGWNGSTGRLTLNQIDMLGIVSKDAEATFGCGGLKEYPTQGLDPTSMMNLEEYHQISENINWKDYSWSTTLDEINAFSDRIDTNKTLTDIKTGLVSGDRTVFAVLLLDFDLGTMGAVGSKNVLHDSWVLTPEIARDAFLDGDFGAHEMVITGYDDDAVSIDDSGDEHRGLLTLRNSWGDKIGDHGNFYMSYDYFKFLVIEAQRIRRFNFLEKTPVNN